MGYDYTEALRRWTGNAYRRGVDREWSRTDYGEKKQWSGRWVKVEMKGRLL